TRSGRCSAPLRAQGLSWRELERSRKGERDDDDETEAAADAGRNGRRRCLPRRQEGATGTRGGRIPRPADRRPPAAAAVPTTAATGLRAAAAARTEPGDFPRRD